MVEGAARAAVALHHERAVVDAAFGAEPLGQTAPPRPLLTRGLVARPRDDVLETLVGVVAGGVEEAGADEDVLVREGEPRPPKLVVDDRLEHLLALAIPLHRRQPDEDAGRAADALEGAEREAEELARLAGLTVQDPLVALLREQPDVVARRPVGADVGHLGQLGVREGGAVLRLDLNRHSPSGAVATSQFQSVRAIRATRRAGRWSSRR